MQRTDEEKAFECQAWPFNRLDINQEGAQDGDDDTMVDALAMNRDSTMVELGLKEQESMAKKMERMSLEAPKNGEHVVERTGVKAFGITDHKNQDASQIFPVSQASADTMAHS